MRMPMPENSIPMLGMQGQFGSTVAGGMLTVLKVRESAPGYEDPGMFDFPEGTLSRRVTAEEIERDGIKLPEESVKKDITHEHENHGD